MANALYESAKEKVRNALARVPKSQPNALLDFARGGLMGVSTDVLGYPVDLATMALRPFGYNVEKPVGGSDWLADRLTYPTNSLAETAGRTLTGMVTPGPTEMLRMAGVVDKAPVQELITYHGSPHRINNVDEANPVGKFDLSKIGTGEGAQAYGHGIYLAENPGVADTYRSMEGRFEFKPVSPEVDAQIKAATNFADRAAIGLRDALDTNNGDLQKTAKSLRLYAQQAEAPEYKAAYSRLAEIVESGGIQPVRAGHFYTVDLPDEHIAKMLDWDKELSKQPASVRKILKESGLLKEYKENLSDFSSPQSTRGSVPRGERLHEFLSWKLGGPEKAAEKLKELGIPGIQYLDGGSRDAGRGTRNFVIFDPEIAKILKRE